MNNKTRQQIVKVLQELLKELGKKYTLKELGLD